MTRKEKAMSLFESGYNCAQSGVLAYEDYFELSRETLARMVSSCGGGMGRLREVCGSMSGVFFVSAELYGYSQPGDFEGKKELYRKVQELAKEFELRNGSIVCRRLLGIDHEKDDFVPEQRNEEYYKKRPCKELVGDAAEILDEIIKKNPI